MCVWGGGVCVFSCHYVLCKVPQSVFEMHMFGVCVCVCVFSILVCHVVSKVLSMLVNVRIREI